MSAELGATTPLQKLLARLDGVRDLGDGQYKAKCPAHDDRHPSLSVKEGDDGIVLVHCHAGCQPAEVVTARGLALADLFPPKPSRIKWLREFTYLGPDGAPIYRVRRGQHANGAKRWITERPTPTGWAKNYDGQRVLYRLPELLGSPDLPVFLTEGERDADALARTGALATTNPFSTWTRVDASPLCGRGVVIVVDADPAGWKRGKANRDAVLAAGATVLRIVAPSAGCKDLTEHIGQGQSVDLLMPVDLDGDDPPEPERRGAARPAFRPDGRAYYVTMPSGVLIGLMQAGRLLPSDVCIYLLLRERAGSTSLARVTGAEVGRLLNIERHAVTKGFARLAECGLIVKRRRGSWTVYDPSQAGRAGGVDGTLTFRDRDPGTTPFLSSKSPSNKTPANGAPAAAPVDPSGTQRATGPESNGAEHTVPIAAEAERLIREAFEGVVEEDLDGR